MPTMPYLRRLRDAERPAEVARVEIRGEAEFGIVGMATASASVATLNTGDSGPERLFACHRRRGDAR